MEVLTRQEQTCHKCIGCPRSGLKGNRVLGLRMKSVWSRLFDERALAQLDLVRCVERGDDVAIQHKSQPLGAVKICMLDRPAIGKESARIERQHCLHLCVSTSCAGCVHASVNVMEKGPSHDTRVGEPLLRQIVNQLPVDEDVTPMRDDLVDLHKHIATWRAEIR